MTKDKVGPKSHISVEIDRSLEVRVKAFANGIGVPLSDVIERAVVYALSSRYPDNALPGAGEIPDQGGPGGGHPDQGGPSGGAPGQLPAGGGGERPSHGLPLPWPPFNPGVDNELPAEEVPIDPDFGVGGDYQRPGLCDGGHAAQLPSAPPTAQPKR
jgi:hypothetical protein